VRLWCYAGTQRKDGDLGGLSDQDIADEIFYDGNSSELLGGLCAIGLVDGPAGARKIHDWGQHQPFAKGFAGRQRKSKKANFIKYNGREEGERLFAEWEAEQRKLLPSSSQGGKTPPRKVLDSPTSTSITTTTSEERQADAHRVATAPVDFAADAAAPTSPLPVSQEKQILKIDLPSEGGKVGIPPRSALARVGPAETAIAAATTCDVTSAANAVAKKARKPLAAWTPELEAEFVKAHDVYRRQAPLSRPPLLHSDEGRRARRLFAERLAEGYTPTELQQSVAGLFADPRREVKAQRRFRYAFEADNILTLVDHAERKASGIPAEMNGRKLGKQEAAIADMIAQAQARQNAAQARLREGGAN
jgi:hypothetical protein